MVNAESAVRRAIALARDTALAQISTSAILPGLEFAAGRVQSKLNLPIFRPPEVEPEVIQLVAKGIHDGWNATAGWVQPTRDPNLSAKPKEKPVDPVFAQETRWTAPVAAAQANPDHGQRTPHQVTESLKKFDFWQDDELSAFFA